MVVAPDVLMLIAARLSGLPPCRPAVKGNEQNVAVYDVTVKGCDLAADGGNHAARPRGLSVGAGKLGVVVYSWLMEARES